MTEIAYRDARYKIEDLLGQKITRIRFSQKPSLSDGLVPLDYFFQDAPEPKETYYEINTGTIFIELANGLVLVFNYSEWGGMNVASAKDLNTVYDPSERENWFEYTEEDQ